MRHRLDQRQTVRGILVVAVFGALTFPSGLLKLGTPVGSVALDSWPGFFVAGYYGAGLGATVAAIGHLTSAATAGFPLHALHIIVAVLQALWAAVFGIIVRRIDRLWAVGLAAVIAVLLNGVLAPIVLIPFAPENKALFVSLIPFLLVASALNVAIASVAIVFTARSRSKHL